jgi:hypothetical protein
MLSHCIELDIECSSVCFSAAQLMAIGGENTALLCEAAREADRPKEWTFLYHKTGKDHDGFLF